MPDLATDYPLTQQQLNHVNHILHCPNLLELLGVDLFPGELFESDNQINGIDAVDVEIHESPFNSNSHYDILMGMSSGGALDPLGVHGMDLSATGPATQVRNLNYLAAAHLTREDIPAVQTALGLR